MCAPLCQGVPGFQSSNCTQVDRAFIISERWPSAVFIAVLYRLDFDGIYTEISQAPGKQWVGKSFVKINGADILQRIHVYDGPR